MSQYLCNLIHDKPYDNQISNMKKIRTAAANKSKETAEDDKDLNVSLKIYIQCVSAHRDRSKLIYKPIVKP